MLLAVIGLVVCPWNYVNSAGTFTSVLSAFGLFISPLIGMYISDFWIIRKRNWKVPDLYIGNNSSAYWYTHGFNLRGFAVWFGTIWLSLRKSRASRPWICHPDPSLTPCSRVCECYKRRRGFSRLEENLSDHILCR